MAHSPTHEESKLRILELKNARSGWKQTEAALKENETYLRALIRTIPDLVWLEDPEGKFLFCNSRFENLFGVEEKDIIGKTTYDLVDKDTADAFRKHDLQVISRGGPIKFEEEVVFSGDGHPEILETIKTPVYKPDGRLAGTLGIGRDISARKRLERERLSNLHFLKCLDKINRALQGTNDPEQMMKDSLDAMLSIFGCDRAFLAAPCDPETSEYRIYMERTNPAYPGAFRKSVPPVTGSVKNSFRELLETPGPHAFYPERGLDPGDEPWKTLDVKSRLAIALYPKVGKPWECGIHQCSHARVWTPHEKKLFLEISHRMADGLSTLLMYRDLQQNREFLDNIVDNIPDTIFVKDAKTLRYVRCNKAGERLLGYSREELSGKKDLDLFPKEKADSFAATDLEALVAARLVDIPEETFRTRGGEERIVHTKKIPILDEAGKPEFLLGISEDITERSRLEEQLRQAQKMESVGRLAGGVAHDFNNMLGIITGHAELALCKANPGAPIAEHLQEIRKAVDRSADLTRKLLAFARKQIVTPKVLDLNETLEGMLKMLRALIGEHIDLAWRPAKEVWPIRMDPSQVDQILANLCVNARDAIPDVGRITIETKNTTFDETCCSYHPEFIRGDFVMLAVGDNGTGMDKITLARIFEPFFTTKEPGKGTGLGLATVYGIVRQNNGFIDVNSKPGEGTTFRIYFPRQASGPEMRCRKEQPAPVAQGRETILLVEDMPEILSLAGMMLERFGYRVIAVQTPEEAIRAAGKHDGEIHLLITDVIMPGMNGRMLAENISTLFPKIRRLFMSGYTNDVIAHHGVLDDGVHFIQKPFTMQSFAAKVREALDTD